MSRFAGNPIQPNVRGAAPGTIRNSRNTAPVDDGEAPAINVRSRAVKPFAPQESGLSTLSSIINTGADMVGNLMRQAAYESEKKRKLAEDAIAGDAIRRINTEAVKLTEEIATGDKVFDDGEGLRAFLESQVKDEDDVYREAYVDRGMQLLSIDVSRKAVAIQQQERGKALDNLAAKLQANPSEIGSLADSAELLGVSPYQFVSEYGRLALDAAAMKDGQTYAATLRYVEESGHPLLAQKHKKQTRDIAEQQQQEEVNAFNAGIQDSIASYMAEGDYESARNLLDDMKDVEGYDPSRFLAASVQIDNGIAQMQRDGLEDVMRSATDDVYSVPNMDDALLNIQNYQAMHGLSNEWADDAAASVRKRELDRATAEARLHPDRIGAIRDAINGRSNAAVGGDTSNPFVFTEDELTGFNSRMNGIETLAKEEANPAAIVAGAVGQLGVSGGVFDNAVNTVTDGTTIKSRDAERMLEQGVIEKYGETEGMAVLMASGHLHSSITNDVLGAINYAPVSANATKSGEPLDVTEQAASLERAMWLDQNNAPLMHKEIGATNMRFVDLYTLMRRTGEEPEQAYRNAAEVHASGAYNGQDTITGKGVEKIIQKALPKGWEDAGNYELMRGLIHTYGGYLQDAGQVSDPEAVVEATMKRMKGAYTLMNGYLVPARGPMTHPSWSIEVAPDILAEYVDGLPEDLKDRDQYTDLAIIPDELNPDSYVIYNTKELRVGLDSERNRTTASVLNKRLQEADKESTALARMSATRKSIASELAAKPIQDLQRMMESATQRVNSLPPFRDNPDAAPERATADRARREYARKIEDYRRVAYGQTPARLSWEYAGDISNLENEIQRVGGGEYKEVTSFNPVTGASSTRRVRVGSISQEQLRRIRNLNARKQHLEQLQAEALEYEQLVQELFGDEEAYRILKVYSIEDFNE